MNDDLSAFLGLALVVYVVLATAFAAIADVSVHQIKQAEQVCADHKGIQFVNPTASSIKISGTCQDGLSFSFYAKEVK